MHFTSQQDSAVRFASTLRLARRAWRVAGVAVLSLMVAILSGCGGGGTATPQAAQPDPPPSIVTQPVSQTVTVGQTAAFSVTATGTAPLSYQWRKGGTPVTGATGSNYTTPATVAADNGVAF